MGHKTRSSGKLRYVDIQTVHVIAIDEDDVACRQVTQSVPIGEAIHDAYDPAFPSGRGDDLRQQYHDLYPGDGAHRLLAGT